MPQFMHVVQEEIAPSNYLIKFLEKSGNDSNMCVDGSSEAVDFLFGADSGEDAKDIMVKAITFVLIANTCNLGLAKFGGNAELTNGIEVHITANGGNAAILSTIKRNEDFAFFTEFQFTPATHDVLKAVLKFDEKFILKANTDDGVKVSIKDNLTKNINFLEAQVVGIKVSE